MVNRDNLKQIFLTATAADTSVDRKGGDTKEHVLAQWFTKHSDTEELASLAVARQQVMRIVKSRHTQYFQQCLSPYKWFPYNDVF